MSILILKHSGNRVAPGHGRSGRADGYAVISKALYTSAAIGVSPFTRERPSQVSRPYLEVADGTLGAKNRHGGHGSVRRHFLCYSAYPQCGEAVFPASFPARHGRCML